MFVVMFFGALAWGQNTPTESALDQANARLINAEAALVEAQAAALDDLLVSATDLSTDEQCGKAPRYGGLFVGEIALELRALRNECLRIKGEATYARVTQTGLVVGDSAYSNAERGVLATGDRPATMAAANDVPMGTGFNDLTRLPYGVSVFSQFQGNALIGQALLANQEISGATPRREPPQVSAPRVTPEEQTAAQTMLDAAQ